MNYFKILISTLIVVLSIVGCNEELVYDVVELHAPIITEINPTEGRQGDLITIIGENLKDVDSVSIGGGSSTIKYRINATSMVVTVNSDSKTGALEVFNSEGSASAPTNFTKLYPSPSVSLYPSSSKAYDKLVIEGADMDVITAVYFDTIPAIITTQQNDLIEVLVPFFRNPEVEIIFSYPVLDGEETMASTSKFELEIVPPTITRFPTDSPDSTEIVIAGDDLYTIEYVMFGDYKGTIVDQGDTTLTVLIPKFPVTSTVPLSMYYYGTEILLSDNFQIQVATLAYWEEQVIYSSMRDGAPTTEATFFDAVFGNLYSPCDWEEKKDNVHFFITVNGGKVRITAQDTDGSKIDNFQCSGTPLAAEPTPNTMRLKRLNSSDSDEKSLIDQVKSKSLEELNSRVLEELGIGNATSNYLETGHFLFGYAEGDVLLFQQYNEDLTFVEYTGALEVVEIVTSADGSEASFKFNAYFGAY